MTLDLDGSVYEAYWGTLTARIDDAAAKWGDRIGWVFEEDREISFNRMKRDVDNATAGLIEIGVRRGDKIALWMPNLYEWCVTAWAGARIGAISVPLNTRFKSFEALHVLSHADVSVLVYQPQFLKIDFDDLLLEVAPDLEISEGGHARSSTLPQLRRVVTVGESRHATLPWERLLEAEPVDIEALEAQIKSTDPVLIQFTSGTTSAPKGALLPHHHVTNYSVEMYLKMKVKFDEAAFNTQPFYHVGGSCTLPMPLALGIKLVMPTYYTPEGTLEAIEKYRCVCRGGITTMFLMEMEHPDFKTRDISSLRAGWTGGPPAVLDRLREAFGIELISLYGATEGGGCYGDLDDPWEIRRISGGRAMTGTELKIVDPETREELPPNQVGEVLFRGWNRMLGYYNDPERTAAAIDADGWVTVGDLARIDEDGFLYFSGRLKDMIRVGGENTSAEEVEIVINEHPAVKLVQVIGVPDARMGEVPLAFVELREGATATEDEIIAHCKQRAANFRVPRYVRFVTDWPYTGSGKMAKGQLREMVADEFGVVGAIN